MAPENFKIQLNKILLDTYHQQFENKFLFIEFSFGEENEWKTVESNTFK